MLSDESRLQLQKMLPPTAFRGFEPVLGKDHPAATGETMDVDVPDRKDGKVSDDREVDAAALFSDPHFLAAARTFQDHLYSDWLSPAHQKKVARFEEGTRNGSLAARWKDEKWLEENPQVTISALELGRHDSTLSSDHLGRTALRNTSLAG